MGDATDDRQTGEDGPEPGAINDPLTRTDVEAPQVPFGTKGDDDGGSAGDDGE